MCADINTDSSRLLHAVAVLRQETLVRCVATAARDLQSAFFLSLPLEKSLEFKDSDGAKSGGGGVN